MIYSFKGAEPQIPESSWAAPSADLIGRVVLGEEVSVWYQCVLRGDYQTIRIGDRSNVQDGTVFHITRDLPALIGAGVTIGHRAVIHACTVEDYCLIGMGAVLLDGCRIGRNSIVGAGSLVTKGKEFPPGSLILGSPAKAFRPLSDDEKAGIIRSRDNYLAYLRDYRGNDDR